MRPFFITQKEVSMNDSFLVRKDIETYFIHVPLIIIKTVDIETYFIRLNEDDD